MTKIKESSLKTTKGLPTQPSIAQTSIYAGSTHWIIEGGKFVHQCGNNCNEVYDILTIGEKTMRFPKNTLRLSEDPGISPNVGKELFEFCADNTNIEWGMEICYVKEHDQTVARILTSNETIKIEFQPSNHAIQFIHSHPNIPNNGEPSPEDLEMARYGSDNIKYTLYYKGDYRDFTYNGFSEDEYWRPQP